MENPEQKPKALPRRFRASLCGKVSYRRTGPKVDLEGLPFLDARDGPPPWEKMVPPGMPVELEVGPGKGRFLLAAARAREEVFFLGVEAAFPYAVYTADRLKRAGLENGLVVLDDATLFLEEGVPEGALQAIHVYFPDPWPKRRHRKRRFFRPGILPLLHRVLSPGGRLFLSTDATAYYGEILALLGTSPWFERLPGLEKEGALPPEEAFGPTNFETKYRREGRTIHKAAWRSLPVPCIPPPKG